jgi:HPt (histidine-containing phosphotransfer) domain-containing protein
MTKLYNLEYLEEISAGDQVFILEMLGDFVGVTPSTLVEIENQIISQNWGELYKIIHRFIPSFEFVGADHMREDLRTLEQYAKTQTNTEKIPLLFENIKGFCFEIIDEIKIDFKL